MTILDKHAIRRSFDLAADSYDAAADMQREIGARLLDHLDLMKLSPRRVMDAGAGTGHALPWLSSRYPDAEVIALDLAPGMLRKIRASQANHGWLGHMAARLRGRKIAPHPTLVCADIEHLPLANTSLDLVWSNLALQWVGDLTRTFRGLHRALRPGGLLLFSSFGPDTLKELRAAFSEIDGYAHVNRFVDMHDVGDALIQAGFKNPVMEMEYLTLTYTELKGLLADLKAIGAHTVLGERRSGLMGRARWRQLEANYERHRQAGRLPATYEVIYGHAWVAEPSESPSGYPTIPLNADTRRR
jgi:malonyl-CoA O-methyltransferase